MKILRNVLIVVLAIILIFGLILYIAGDNMYKNALAGKSLEDVIAEIQSDPNYVEYEDLPQNYINAVIAVEDHRFREHGAIDLIAIARAIYVNISTFSLREGGSTITQQVAKNIFYITEDNPVVRKSAEILTSFDLEDKYTKNDILELYVNTIYFGDGYYGIEEACQGYLNKDATEMTLADSTMMAGIPNAPSVYAPTVNPDLTRDRQEKVISSMVEYNYISETDANNLIDSLDEYYENLSKLLKNE